MAERSSRSREPDARMIAFVREHGDRVSAWLRRFGVPESDLADARQDVWVAAFRHFDELGDAACQRGWLYTVCRRTAKDLRRRAQRRYECVDAAPLVVADADQAQRLEARARLSAVQRAAGGLSRAQRDVWLARSLDAASTQQLAARQGCSPKTIFSRLYAARAHLRRKLAEEGWLAGIFGVRMPFASTPQVPTAASAVTASLACVVITAAIVGEDVAPARLAGGQLYGLQDRRVPYVSPSATKAHTLLPTHAPAGKPRARRNAIAAMRFDVLDVATPRASLTLQRTGVLDFEPVVIGTGEKTTTPAQALVVTHPPDIKPSLSRPFTRVGSER